MVFYQKAKLFMELYAAVTVSTLCCPQVKNSTLNMMTIRCWAKHEKNRK